MNTSTLGARPQPSLIGDDPVNVTAPGQGTGSAPASTSTSIPFPLITDEGLFVGQHTGIPFWLVSLTEGETVTNEKVDLSRFEVTEDDVATFMENGEYIAFDPNSIDSWLAQLVVSPDNVIGLRTGTPGGTQIVRVKDEWLVGTPALLEAYFHVAAQNDLSPTLASAYPGGEDQRATDAIEISLDDPAPDVTGNDEYVPKRPAGPAYRGKGGLWAHGDQPYYVVQTAPTVLSLVAVDGTVLELDNGYTEQSLKDTLENFIQAGNWVTFDPDNDKDWYQLLVGEGPAQALQMAFASNPLVVDHHDEWFENVAFAKAATQHQLDTAVRKVNEIIDDPSASKDRKVMVMFSFPLLMGALYTRHDAVTETLDLTGAKELLDRIDTMARTMRDEEIANDPALAEKLQGVDLDDVDAVNQALDGGPSQALARALDALGFGEPEDEGSRVGSSPMRTAEDPNAGIEVAVAFRTTPGTEPMVAVDGTRYHLELLRNGVARWHFEDGTVEPLNGEYYPRNEQETGQQVRFIGELVHGSVSAGELEAFNHETGLVYPVPPGYTLRWNDPEPGLHLVVYANQEEAEAARITASLSAPAYELES